MINVLSYIGMTEHSEVCLWTLLGLVRTIFDATLFRVNANLKQVWQMTMPEELSMPVQRVLRTMISGVMLVQCFTVYVYLASYIVLLYPVFLEERPNLVLPWLLLAAVRQLLCELTSLALGLGTCVLLGPARPPCIKFVVIKLVSIMPAFYMWMLLFSYYHTLKVAAAFKRFPTVLQSSDRDYGLELAIRRRRTKSLLGEEQLRSKLVASLYGERHAITGVATKLSKIGVSSRMAHSTDTSITDFTKEEVVTEALQRNSAISHRMSETGSYEDWFGSEVVLPRGSDRILEQFVLMLLRIRACLDKKDVNGISSQMLSKSSHSKLLKYDNLNCSSISTDDSDTPLLVGSSKENTSSYLRDYPQIFMKKNSVEVPRTENTITLQTRQESDDTGSVIRTRKRSVMISKKEMITLEVEKIVSHRKYTPEVKKQQRKPSQTKNTSSLKTLNEVNINDRNMGVLMTTDNTTLHSVDNTPNITINEAQINDEAMGVLIKTDNSTLSLDPIKTENNNESNENQQSMESIAFEIKDVNCIAGYSKRNMNHDDNVKRSHKIKESSFSTANDTILEESSSSTKNNDELLKQPFSATKNNATNKSGDEKTKKVRDNK